MVRRSGEVPVISGSHMLKTSHALLRLQRQSTEAAVKLRCRMLVSSNATDANLHLTVATIGGDQRNKVWIAMTNPTESSSAGQVVGEVQEISVPILEQGNDVLVQLDMAEHSGISGDEEAISLDDVRLE